MANVLLRDLKPEKRKKLAGQIKERLKLQHELIKVIKIEQKIDLENAKRKLLILQGVLWSQTPLNILPRLFYKKNDDGKKSKN